ncbi:MAG: hypothetical protein H7Y13_04380 [Sphingobacteriaceae bacterium]|nr:hypothetical protein [Sphingobacteriaceae bacterium]
MASKTPIVRQVSWPSVIFQLILLGLLICIFQIFEFAEPFFTAALTYAILAFGLRIKIARSHRKGLQLIKQQKPIEALPFFEKSVNYFTKFNWIDKYRYLTLLSSSKMTYREMGLCNIAFCYSQTGEGYKAKEVYQMILKEYPENGLAYAGYNMLNSLEQSQPD